MVSANLKRRATRAARVQLDAYQEPRAASSSGHIVRCRQATCYRVGSLAPLISAPAVTRPRVRMHRRRAHSRQNGARCVPHRCAARYPRQLMARYPSRHGIPRGGDGCARLERFEERAVDPTAEVLDGAVFARQHDRQTVARDLPLFVPQGLFVRPLGDYSYPWRSLVPLATIRTISDYSHP